MVASGTPIDRFFHDWRGGVARNAAAYTDDSWTPFRQAVSGVAAVPDARQHPYWADDAPCSMLIEEVEAIWQSIDTQDDWSPLYAKVAAIRRMGDALGAYIPGFDDD
jgi:hypothetical protein